MITSTYILVLTNPDYEVSDYYYEATSYYLVW